MNDYKFPCDPLANPEAIILGRQYRFTILDSRVLRYEWAEDGVFEDRPSTFAVFRNFPKPDFRVKDTPGQLEIITPSVRLTYDKKRFSPNGLFAALSSKLTDHGAEWRYGEQRDENNLGGTVRTLDLVDGRCELEAGIISSAGYATLDDTSSMVFDKNQFLSPRPAGDRIDGYLFGYGSDYKAAMESFFAISGPQPTVPRWCLGNWWSRYYAYNQKEYLTLMERFRNEQIPLSVAVIDMDWHWVKESLVPHTGWTGYTWNTKLFPDPAGFADALHKMRLKTTLNDHPHSGIHHHEEMYEDMAQVLGHDTSQKDPILFDPTSPAYMHAYLNVVHRRLEKLGCDFWWIDWQQGLQSRLPGFDPLWALNHFQFLDTLKSANEDRPIIFSRYAGPGSHRYPVGFSGDTVASWDSLQFQPEFTATASNIGFGWWSHDIGGHLPGYRDDECTTRWVQYGVFSPILRLHSTVSSWMSKEPWLYRSEHMRAMVAALQLRHRLVPYIYSVNASQHIRTPLVLPLYWNFPQHDVAYQYSNQYFFGPSLVVVPVVTPRDPRTNLAKVKAWIPPQRHVDMSTGIVYDGNREINLYRALEEVPVFLREGSIIPLDESPVPSNGCLNPTSLEVLVIVGRDGHFELVEDPRDDEEPRSESSSSSRRLSITYEQTAGRLICPRGDKEWLFRFMACRADPMSIQVQVGGTQPADNVSIAGTPSSSRSDILVRVPRALEGAAAQNDMITITLGPDPQLAIIDQATTLHAILRDYQIGFKDKDRIWAIVESDQRTTVKISSLLGLGLEDDLSGPLIERLSADSRSG